MIRIAFVVLLPFLVRAQTPMEQGVKFFADKKYKEGANVFQSVKEGEPTYAEAQYYLGRIAYAESKYDEAIEFLEGAIEVNNKVADYHFWLGNVYGSVAQNANVFKQGMLASKVKEEFEITVKLDPKHLGGYQGLISFYSQAPGVMGGSWEKAHECADQIKKIKLAEGCRAKAGIYQRQENFIEAEKEWKNAVKADETYLPALVSFYTTQKKYTNAFTALDEALKKNPDHMGLSYQFGRTSAMSGERLEQGESYLKKYLTYRPKENEPSIAGANMRLGQIMEKKGNKGEAKRLFQTAVQLDPNLKEAKEGLERVM